MIRSFIDQEIAKIPERFSCNDMIGIGGTLRSLSKIIMERTNYPLNTVHGFEYEIDAHASFVNAIVSSDVLGLKNLGVRKDRYDTMREGCIIFQSIYQKLICKTMITSGAGVREGAYLCDLLRSQHHKFTPNFKLSLKSFKDRFSIMEEDNLYIKRVSHLLFDTLAPLHGISEVYKDDLGVAAELHNIGTTLGFYQNHLHSFYFILNNLNYGFSHQQKILIAMLIKYHVNKLPTLEDMALYKTLLPDMQTVQWLSFILSLAKAINSDMSRSPISFRYQNHTLTIQAEKKLFLAREQIKQLMKPASFAIIIK